METLQFDTGVKEFECNSGAVLRFNPTSQNVYARFVAFYEELPGLGEEYDAILKMDREIKSDDSEESEPSGAFAAAILDFDRRLKNKLADVFGPGNDFDAIFEGVNLMEMTDSGQEALLNFMDAIYPIIETNIEHRKKMRDKVAVAKKKQAANRAQRRIK